MGTKVWKISVKKVRMLTIIQIGSKEEKLKGEFLPGNRGRYIIISFSQDYQKQNSPAYPDPKVRGTIPDMPPLLTIQVMKIGPRAAPAMPPETNKVIP